jgi:fatty-acyl-CoA synthase
MSFSLVDVTAKRAALTPHRIAFEDVVSGRTLTYAELDDRARRCAGVLVAHGVEREDRVAVLCRNRTEFFELLFACAKVGAILVPLNWRSPAAELALLLDDCTPRILFFGAEDEAVAAALRRPDVPLIALDGGYDALLQAAQPHSADLRWDGAAAWSLIYTSGTTGAPKAVIQTFQMAAVNAFHVAHAFGVTGADRTINFLPLFHTAGLQLVTLPVLMAGGRVSVLPGFDAERVLRLLSATDVFFGVPAVYQQLALHPRFEQASLAGVRAWGCGGAPLPDVMVEIYARKGVRICNGYGMTETGPTAFVAAPEDALSKIGSAGKPQMLLEVRIVDSAGRDVAQGEAGEIWMRGPGLTPGYWRKPEETAKAFSDDGWLKSGDLGRCDADGAYYIVGRSKEMYISGGENVYPAEIENVLARHPAVLEAAVVGTPDAKWGEVGCAYVMLRPGCEAPSSAEIIAFCRSRLAAYKTPARVEFVEDFPRTAAGKVRKHMLKPS